MRETILRSRAVLALGLAALLGVAYGVMVVSALSGGVLPFAIAAVASILLDWAMRRTRYRRLLLLLTRNGASLSWRFFIRRLLIVVLLDRAARSSHAALAAVVVAVLLLHIAYVATVAIVGMIGARRLRRIETRNLDVAGPELPPNRWPALRGTAGTVVLHAEVFIVAALLWAGVTGDVQIVVIGAVAMVVAGAIVPGVLVGALVELRRMPDKDERMASAQRAVDQLDPVVILYFSGGTASIYQVNTWLSTLERLERPILVLLRERRYLSRLNPTKLPVLCIPYAADLMNFELPAARVALYVANVGKNIHLLRVPTIKSAFIGHGDSDKTASFNPFTKVYDEVWVAGAAGRERYVRARVGVRDEDVVEVGRPQLDVVGRPGDRPPNDWFTVLYAPTWEGWVNDPFATSVVLLGSRIVAEMLATPGVRLMYKPHPLTGSVSAAARDANAEIISLVLAAGLPHLNVVDDTPLYDCFNESDAMISDISSVVSDYLRSDKPYFVTNPAGLTDAVFRLDNPSAGAAYLVGPDGNGLVSGLADARGRDTLKIARRETSTYFLGDPNLDALASFSRALGDLIAKSEADLVAARGEADDHPGSSDRDDLLALDWDESTATGEAPDSQPGIMKNESTREEI